MISETSGVAYWMKLSGSAPPQYTPVPRSSSFHVTGFQSGASTM